MSAHTQSANLSSLSGSLSSISNSPACAVLSCLPLPAALCTFVLQHRLPLSGVLELLLVTYSLSGDRKPPATPLYSGDEAQIREALADVILAHASAAAAAVAAAGQDQQQVQQVLGTLHQELQCLPQPQQLVLEVRGKHR